MHIYTHAKSVIALPSTETENGIKDKWWERDREIFVDECYIVGCTPDGSHKYKSM